MILSTITMFHYSSTCSQQVALSMLEVIGRDPDWWLMDVSDPCLDCPAMLASCLPPSLPNPDVSGS